LKKVFQLGPFQKKLTNSVNDMPHANHEFFFLFCKKIVTKCHVPGVTRVIINAT